MKYWTESGEIKNDKVHSSDIELTSYILLAKLENFKQDDAASMVPIVKWINSQRNSLGGFYSTQVCFSFKIFKNPTCLLVIGYSCCLRCSFEIRRSVLFKKN